MVISCPGFWTIPVRVTEVVWDSAAVRSRGLSVMKPSAHSGSAPAGPADVRKMPLTAAITASASLRKRMVTAVLECRPMRIDIRHRYTARPSGYVCGLAHDLLRLDLGVARNSVVRSADRPPIGARFCQWAGHGLSNNFAEVSRGRRYLIDA